MALRQHTWQLQTHLTNPALPYKHVCPHTASVQQHSGQAAFRLKRATLSKQLAAFNTDPSIKRSRAAAQQPERLPTHLKPSVQKLSRHVCHSTNVQEYYTTFSVLTTYWLRLSTYGQSAGQQIASNVG